MKKLLSYIFIGLVAAGCTEMYGPEQHPTPVVPSEGLELRVLEVGDNTAKVQLAPAGEASYYSYCVLPAENAEAKPLALDSVAVYRNAYKSEAVQSGAIKWTAEKPSADVLVKGLESDAYYYVYAVAGSVEGIPSSVVSAAIHTSDKVNPSVPEDGVTTEENVITMTFSEKVTVAKDLKLVANYYGLNSDAVLAAQPLGSVDIPAKAIVAKANVVTITVPELPAGAVYAVSIPAKAFLDSVGNGNEEIESSFGLNPETYEPEAAGIIGEISNKDFKLKDLDIPYIFDLKPLATTGAAGETLYYTGKKEGIAEYVSGKKVITQPMPWGVAFGKNKAGEILFLLENIEAPEIGTKITVTVPKGTFQDDFANSNAEWSFTTVYAYPYVQEDIYGLFTGPTVSVVAGGVVESGMQIAPLESTDNPKYGNCKIVMFGGIPADNTVYATFFPKDGKLVIPSGQIINKKALGLPVLLLTFTGLTQGSEDPIILSMPKKGILASPTEEPIIYVNNPDASSAMENIYDWIQDLQWEKQPEA